jgi:hypothetical protein
MGANLTFQRQAFALANDCSKTHLEIHFFLFKQQGKLLHA